MTWLILGLFLGYLIHKFFFWLTFNQLKTFCQEFSDSYQRAYEESRKEEK